MSTVMNNMNTSAVRNFTITRVSPEVYEVTGNFPFWHDGQHVEGRFAFNEKPVAGLPYLSNVTAQGLDRKVGNRYILVGVVAIRTPHVLAAARALAVGATATVAA